MRPDRSRILLALAVAPAALASGCASADHGAHPAPPGAPVVLSHGAENGAPQREPALAQVWVEAPAGPTLAAAVAPLVAAAPAEGEVAGDPVPEVVAHGARVDSESDPVGVYGQPEWTTRRRFARSRVYVLPEGQVEVEQWWRGTFDHGESPSHLFQTEVGIGLPNRFQADIYGNTVHEDGRTVWSGLQPELRWAPADWGVLPLNPTLYLEYKWQHHANDVAEGKILFGDDLAKDVHWAMNLSCEQELGGEREQELAITQAVSWALSDRQFGVGVEFEVDRVTAAGSRDDAEWQYYLGPSFQWRPTPETHLDVVPLRGWHDAHDWRVFVVFGIDFGGAKAKAPSGPEPVISKSR